MNIGMIIVIAFAVLWALGVFMGAIGGFSKGFSNTPQAIDSSDIKSQQRRTIDETEEKRQKMMDDIKQKMQDASFRR